jgi:hypothetical protein
MRCEVCQGCGRVPNVGGPEWMPTILCTTCYGAGQQHCCEGLREQPDGDTEGDRGQAQADPQAR